MKPKESERLDLKSDYEQVGHHRGIAIEARDKGPGIPDITLAMRDGYSTANTLGAGLPGVKRLMDTFEITSEVGVGTRARATKWLEGVARCHLCRLPGDADSRHRRRIFRSVLAGQLSEHEQIGE